VNQVCEDCSRDLGPPSRGADAAARVYLRWLQRRYPGTRWRRVLRCHDCFEAEWKSEAGRGVTGHDSTPDQT
jgi:hypothetical protein